MRAVEDQRPEMRGVIKCQAGAACSCLPSVPTTAMGL